ncbi:MAG: 3-phosphoshikimate 1-carboxyvinyltransferase [Ignavibacteria bacterium]
MKRSVQPCPHPVNAVVSVPGSKSLTNRALMCAALARGEAILRRASPSTDTALMINGLNQLGILVRRKEDALIVSGGGGKVYAPKFPIPVGNAGTTMRFLISLAALAPGKTVLEGDERMAERPLEELLEALAALGVRASREGWGRCTVYGGTLAGGSVTLRAAKSSQFLSSLLMASPYAASDVTIVLDGPLPSAPYVEMTKRVMMHFGVGVEQTMNSALKVRKGQCYRAADLTIESDASSAGYFFAAAAVCGGDILVRDLSLHSQQPDVQMLALFQRMGCVVREEAGGVRLTGTGVLNGIEADMNATPDAVPTIAAVALFASTPTRIAGVAHLRYKESDRLAALERELRKLGADVRATDDALIIHPTPLHGGVLETYNDHRLAMSFAVIGLKIPGIEIVNPSCVSKSFPTFWDQLTALYLRSSAQLKT